MRGFRIAFLAVVVLGAMVVAPLSASADHGLPWHWNRNSPTVTAVAQVYFEDYSGTNWHIQTEGVDRWNNAPNYYLPYRVNGGTCNHSQLHCVPVRSGDYGATGWYGITTYQVTSGNHVLHDSMLVRFNTHYALTQAQKNSTVCHELGHATGTMTEGTHTDSCMYGIQPVRFPAAPSGHDYDIIRDRYNH